MSLPALSSWGPGVFSGAAAFVAALLLARRAMASSRSDGLIQLLGPPSGSAPGRRLVHWFRLRRSTQPAWGSLTIGAALGWLGFLLVGIGGAVAGAGIGIASPLLREAGRRRKSREAMEHQVAEVAESAAMGVRSGLSIRQALEFTASEVGEPIRRSMEELLRSNALGAPLERAITRWASDIGTDEAKLLALVLTIHVRSGGDLAGALQEVAGTIRHRISVRRELRAMSAQGRISGAILGSLPIAFFLVLALTSRSELVPVYRSPAGLAMLCAGLTLESLAYVWIRRLLRVEV